MKIVKVMFTNYIVNMQETSEKVYYYRCEFDSIKPSNMVVVYSNNKQLGIGTVLAVYDDTFENAGIANRATAYVVSIIDISAIVAREEAKARREYLTKKLEEKRAAMEDLLIYKALAAEDAEAAAMLTELKQLEIK